MKTHKVVIRPNRYGGTNTSSLCGRLNKASTDGMNVTDVDADVTCGFCKKQIAWDAEREEWRKARAAKGLPTPVI